MSRARRLLMGFLGLLTAAACAPAFGQNLDAGKSASQIFSEVCSNCHRSTREVKGASASFLREHYTTGSEMAGSLASYLSSAAAERAPTPPQPKRPPAPTTAATAPAAPAAPTPPAAVAGRDARARSPATAEAKPAVTAPPAPARPVLEEFEE